MRSICVILLVAVSLTISTPARPRPIDSPQTFFEGRTEGTGSLKIIFRKVRATAVHGAGRTERDGTLVLDQIVEQQGEAVKRRQWRLREIAPGRFSGTLSDAEGPVTGEIAGNLMHFRFAMKGGYQAEQWLRVSPDGQTARNSAVISKLGVTVATLEETIRRSAAQ